MYIKDCFTIIKFKELFSSPNSQFLSYQPFLVSFSFIAKALPCSLFGHYSTRNILTKICMQKPNFPTFLVIPMYSACSTLLYKSPKNNIPRKMFCTFIHWYLPGEIVVNYL